MRRTQGAVAMLIMAALFGCGAAAWALPEPEERGLSRTAFILTDADPASEAGRLFIDNMLLSTAAAAFSPQSFSLTAKGLGLATRVARCVQAGALRRVGAAGRFGLYAVELVVTQPPLPHPQREVVVRFSLASLATRGGIVQPGTRAIELAARKAGWASGRAWILDLSLQSSTEFEARVALAK